MAKKQKKEVKEGVVEKNVGSEGEVVKEAGLVKVKDAFDASYGGIVDAKTKDEVATLIENPDTADDIMFSNMSEENKKKFGFNMSMDKVEARFTQAVKATRSHLNEYAIQATRLIRHKRWEEMKDPELRNRFAYFMNVHSHDYQTAERHYLAVECLTLVERDVATLDLYKVSRLARFFEKMRKGVAPHSDFKKHEQKFLMNPEAKNFLHDKDFDKWIKDEYGPKEQELAAKLANEDPDSVLTPVKFNLPQTLHKQLSSSHDIAVKEAKLENRVPPGLGEFVVEAAANWSAQHGTDLAVASDLLRSYQRAFHIALLPFPVHQHQELPQGLEGLNVYECNGGLCLEGSKKEAAKYFGVPVSDVKVRSANVSHYMERAQIMSKDELKALSEGNAPAEENASEPEPVAKPKKEKKFKGEKAAAEPAKVVEAVAQPPKEGQRRKISELNDDEVSAMVATYRKKLNLSNEKFAEIADGKTMRAVLGNLVKLVKEKAQATEATTE